VKVSEEACECGLYRPLHQQMRHCDHEASALLLTWCDSSKNLLSFTNFSSKTSDPSSLSVTSTQLLLLRAGTFSANYVNEMAMCGSQFPFIQHKQSRHDRIFPKACGVEQKHGQVEVAKIECCIVSWYLSVCVWLFV